MNMIDEILNKYDIQPNKFYTISDLHKVMQELGLTNTSRSSFTNDFINRKINKGSLVLPPRSDNSQIWRITGKQLKGIVESFVPGGKGSYNYQDDESDVREDQTSP